MKIAILDGYVENPGDLSRAGMDACPGVKFISALAAGYNVVN